MKTAMAMVSIVLPLLFGTGISSETLAQISSSLEIKEAVTMEETRLFIDEYVTRFMKLDLDPFMELFSKEAVENRMLPYDDIRSAYKKTIAGSRSIIYRVKIYSIQAFTDSAFVSGAYEIVQAFKVGKVVFKGNIQWDLVRENGSLRIREVNYGKDR
jgi:hypothetical protein